MAVAEQKPLQAWRVAVLHGSNRTDTVRQAFTGKRGAARCQGTVREGSHSSQRFYASSEGHWLHGQLSA